MAVLEAPSHRSGAAENGPGGQRLFDRAKLSARIGYLAAEVFWENLSRPMARKACDVPRSHLGVTAEWLTQVLCTDKPDAKVVGVSLAGGSLGSSTREALNLELNQAALDAGVPSRLFTKSTMTLSNRLLLGLSNCIQGEVGFYMHFRPNLKVEAPWGYYACYDPRTLRSIILMEDIALSKGAEFLTPSAEISQSDMESLLAGMAIWHGQYWDRIRVASDYPWLRTPRKFVLEANAFIDFKGQAAIGTRVAHDIIPASLRDNIDAIWVAALTLNERDLESPATLLHGDAHVAQTYRTRDGGMGFADWQVLLGGHWAWDVSYIMTTALTVENRRAWERDLLRHYLAALHAAGGPSLAFDDAWKAYRQHALWPYLAWAFTIARDASNRVQPTETTVPLVERTAHAIDDLEATKAVLR